MDMFGPGKIPYSFLSSYTPARLIATSHRSPTFDGNIKGAGSFPLATPYHGTRAEHVGLKWIPARSPALMYSVALVPLSFSRESGQSKNSILVLGSLTSIEGISFSENITGWRYLDSSWTTPPVPS